MTWCGETSIEGAFKVYCTSKRMMSEDGFNLKKWVSNSPELSRGIRIVESVLDGDPIVAESQSQVAKEEESLPRQQWVLF